MAHYIVKAQFHLDLLSELRARLDRGEIRKMRPFGSSLHYSLDNARLSPQGWAVWEEEDYCNPPLAQERTAVLDTYFCDIQVERVSQGSGWKRIESLPMFWDTREIGG